MRAIHGGAAPFPLPPPINQAPESAAATRNVSSPLPHPLTADDGGDDNGWERLAPAHRRDVVNAVVRKCELIFVCVSMSDDRCAVSLRLQVCLHVCVCVFVCMCR